MESQTSNNITPDSNQVSLDLDLKMADNGEPKNLLEEMTDAELVEKAAAMEREKVELEKKLKRITEQARVETQERHLNALKTQIDQMMEARKQANSRETVFNSDVLGDSETAKQMLEMFNFLKREEQERLRLQQEREQAAAERKQQKAESNR